MNKGHRRTIEKQGHGGHTSGRDTQTSEKSAIYWTCTSTFRSLIYTKPSSLNVHRESMPHRYKQSSSLSLFLLETNTSKVSEREMNNFLIFLLLLYT